MLKPPSLAELPRFLCLVWIGGIVCFIVALILSFRRHRRAKLETTHLRLLVKVARLLLSICLLLLVPLVLCAGQEYPAPVPTPVTEYENKKGSWNYGFGRPLWGMTCIAIGLFLDYHPAVRWICVQGLVITLVGDAVSVFDLVNHLDCVNAERCALVAPYTVEAMQFLCWRDLVGSFFGVWALLQVLYLAVSIGLCNTRHTYSALHPGQHNRALALRRELIRSAPLGATKGKGGKGGLPLVKKRDLGATEFLEGGMGE